MHQHGHDDPNAKKLYELIKDVKIAMMTTAEGGKLHTRPMYNMDADEHGDLWFFTQIALGEDARRLSARQRGQSGLLGPVQPDLRVRDRQARNRPGQGQDRRQMVGAAEGLVSERQGRSPRSHSFASIRSGASIWDSSFSTIVHLVRLREGCGDGRTR